MENVNIYLTCLSDPPGGSDFAVRFADEMARRNIQVNLEMVQDSAIDPARKAEYVNEAMQSNLYDWFVDVSGGNLANTAIPYIDLGRYSECKGYFVGFSDLSCVLNALSYIGKKPCLYLPVYYQLDFDLLAALFKKEDSALTDLSYQYQSGDFKANAPAAGGNIRCFLKLAGTPWFPDLDHKNLFLEGNGTSKYELISLLAQLKQTGKADHITGIVFGYFTKIYNQEIGYLQGITSFLQEALNMAGFKDIPWALTLNVGHIENSRGLWITG